MSVSKWGYLIKLKVYFFSSRYWELNLNVFILISGSVLLNQSIDMQLGLMHLNRELIHLLLALYFATQLNY